MIKCLYKSTQINNLKVNFRLNVLYFGTGNTVSVYVLCTVSNSRRHVHNTVLRGVLACVNVGYICEVNLL